MYDYFVWIASLHKTAPLLCGLMVLVTMSGMGLILATAADIVVRLTGINVGSYKKEYEDQLPGH
jgi:hypothetical protein